MTATRDERIEEAFDEITGTCRKCGYTNRHHVHCEDFMRPRDALDMVGIIEMGVPLHLNGEEVWAIDGKIIEEARWMKAYYDQQTLYPGCVPKDQRPS